MRAVVETGKIVPNFGKQFNRRMNDPAKFLSFLDCKTQFKEPSTSQAFYTDIQGVTDRIGQMVEKANIQTNVK